jgi:hypothetical protein
MSLVWGEKFEAACGANDTLRLSVTKLAENLPVKAKLSNSLSSAPAM